MACYIYKNNKYQSIEELESFLIEEVIQFQKEGLGLLPNGFVDLNTKEVFLNQETANLDTPIHEFSHLFTDMLKQTNPQLYKRGLELIEKEGKEYIDFVKKNQPNLKGEALLDEALNQAVGEAGEKIVNKQSEFFQWLQDMWDSLKDMIGLTQYSWNEVKDMNLQQFTEAMAVDLLRGEELKFESEAQAIKEQAIANGTFMKAPNGKDTNLNERQWLTVRTKAFKDWFGDWQNNPQNASKVVDENGEPLVVYHGTNENFNVFEDYSKIGREFKEFFFARKENEHFPRKSDIRIVEVFLNIKNIATAKEYNNIQESTKQDKDYRAGNPRYLTPEYAQKKGFDGVRRGVEYIAFHPNQIKSATDNVGTFLSESNDIRYQKMGGLGEQTQSNFKPITKRQLNQLVRGLTRAFKKAGKETKVHVGAKKMADRLKQLAERGYNTPRMQHEYRILHTAPTRDDGMSVSIDRLNETYPDDVYSDKGWHYYGDGDRTMDKQSHAKLRSLKGKPDAKVTVYRAVPKGVTEINDGDWITINRNYAVSHGESHIDGDYDVISLEVRADQVFTDANSLHEQGIQFLQTKDGTIYGLVDPVTGDIYMDGDLMNANTPIHEFGHLWISNVQQTNPKLWERMVNVAKQTPEWNRLANDPNYKQGQFAGKKGKALDNAIADEVWATIIGNHGENNFETILEKMDGDRSLAQKVWDAIQDFWQSVADFLYDAGIFSGYVTLPNGVRLQVSGHHGTPHQFPKELLVAYEDGTTEYLVGTVDTFPEVPEGAKVVKEFPKGRFRLDKIGTGEGMQAFSWGLYFTDLESIARNYAAMNSTKVNSDVENYLRTTGDYIHLSGLTNSTVDIDYAMDERRGSLEQNLSDHGLSVKEYIGILERQLEDNKKFYDNVDPSDSYSTILKQEFEKSLENVEPVLKKIRDIVGSENLYNVTLHKGKAPSEYTWLEWDSPISNTQKEILFKNVSESSLSGEIHDIEISDRFDADSFDGGKTYRVGDTSKMGQEDEFTNVVYNTLEEALIEATRLNFSDTNIRGRDFYESLAKELGQKQASLFLLENGIDGVRYPAESISRGATSDNARGFNYVVFDENAVTIEEYIRFQQGNQNESDQSLQNPEVAAIADMVLEQMMSGEFGTSNPVMDFAMQYASESELLRDTNGNVIGVKPEVLEEIRKEREQIETEARANGTFMKAPTNLNEDQWVTVRTKRFKDWFGDWQNDPQNASKVVDENEEPSVVYHGTASRFEEFRKDKISTGADNGFIGDLGEGFYFAKDKKMAERFSLYLLEKRKNNPHLKGLRGEELAEYLEKNSSEIPIVMSAFLNVRILEDINNLQTNDSFTSDVGGRFSSRGFYEIVVNSPNQIKSTTGNVGTFANETNNVSVTTNNQETLNVNREDITTYETEVGSLNYITDINGDLVMVTVENPIDTVNNTPITNPLVKMPNRYRVAYDLGEINEEALFNQSYLTNEVRDYIIERNPELEGKDFTAQQIAQGVNVNGAISENLDTNEGYQKALEVQRKVDEGLLPWSALTPAIQSELLLETNPIVEVSEETEISSPLFESIKRLPIIDSEQALLIYQESFSTSLENWEDLDTKC